MGSICPFYPRGLKYTLDYPFPTDKRHVDPIYGARFGTPASQPGQLKNGSSEFGKKKKKKKKTKQGYKKLNAILRGKKWGRKIEELKLLYILI